MGSPKKRGRPKKRDLASQQAALERTLVDSAATDPAGTLGMGFLPAVRDVTELRERRQAAALELELATARLATARREVMDAAAAEHAWICKTLAT